MSNLLYDMVLMEAERISYYKQKDLELYYKDKYGELTLLAEPYDEAVQEVLKQLLKRKRMRYFLTFAEGFEVLNDLNKAASRLLIFLAQNMRKDNMIKDYTIRDLGASLGSDLKNVIKGLRLLCEKDVVRFVIIRNKRTYMINPVYFYRGSIKSVFKTAQKYESEFPKRGRNLKEI